MEEKAIIYTHLELLEHITTVQSRIKKDITSDYILTKLEPQDKEGIINTTVNAHIARKRIENAKKRITHHQWNPKTQQWEQTPYPHNDKIDQIANETFDLYMTKAHMTAILNRNVPQNHILEFLKQTPTLQEQQTNEQTTENKIKETIKKALKKQPEETQQQ